MLNIFYSKDALKDLSEISYYISLDNPFESKKVIEEIYSSIDYLKDFPYLWKQRKDWLRELVSKNKYRVFYKIGEGKIYILSIFKYKNSWE